MSAQYQGYCIPYIMLYCYVTSVRCSTEWTTTLSSNTITSVQIVWILFVQSYRIERKLLGYGVIAKEFNHVVFPWAQFWAQFFS